MTVTRVEIRPGRTLQLELYPHAASDTAVFMLHGLGGRSAQWRRQIDVLRERYTLVLPNLLGHAQSEKPVSKAANLYRFQEMALDMQAVFARYQARYNVMLGHSYGGALAVALALAYPQQIQRLVLVNPAVYQPDQPVPLVSKLPVFILERLRPYLEKRFQRLAFAPGAAPHLIAEESAVGRRNQLAVIKDMIAGIKTMEQPALHQLKTPSLIILGEHDGIVPPKVSRDFYSVLPQHTFRMIQQASHMVMLEKPQEVNAAIVEFLGESAAAEFS